MTFKFRTSALILAGISAMAPAAYAAPAHPHRELTAAVAAPSRSTANKARDIYRNPAETLSFFGIKPSDTVVEIWPGGGWYTEILAPYLKDKGKLIVAAPTGNASANIGRFLDSDAAVYGQVGRANFPILMGGTGVAPGTADAVLTFRNVHNWRMGSYKADGADYSAEAFKELYAMLKPGGVLGIEDHRLPENASDEQERKSGYIKVSTIRRLAEQAGFRFAGSSEINANPKDTKDYPRGVWTLPPRLAEGDKDREKYLAIGESDRMTLKFIKPAK
ncbi:MAG: methyltransferase [Sphingomonadaceae bacterium]|jgi:predicted methyltransferase|nr:methyltransferase [Sphingomonadaceae bacterium]NBU79083.1 methyltransferase [Sphingomonadaceae bacterium]NCA01836.1 methyltransferase [Sphingomonadaceae bacterium]